MFFQRDTSQTANDTKVDSILNESPLIMVSICKKLHILPIFSDLFMLYYKRLENLKTYLTSSTYTCLFLFHRFTEVDDYRWFYKTIERVAEEELGAKYQPMVKDEEYFVDFLRYDVCYTRIQYAFLIRIFLIFMNHQ